MKHTKNMALGRVGQHTRCCVEIVEEHTGPPWQPDSWLAAVLANRKARLGTVPEQGLKVHPAGSASLEPPTAPE